MPSRKTASRKRCAQSDDDIPSTDFKTTLNSLKTLCSTSASEQAENASKKRIEKGNKQLIEAERAVHGAKQRYMSTIQAQLSKKKRKCVDDLQRKLADRT